MPSFPKIDCRAATDSLSEYIDGGLSSDEAQGISGHLDACQPCERLKLEIEELRLAARELPLHSPNQRLWTRVRAEVEAEILSQPVSHPVVNREKSWWQRIFDWKVTLKGPQLVGATVMVAILAGFATLALRPQGEGLQENGLLTLSASLVPGEIELRNKLNAKMTEFNSRKANWDPQLRGDFESFLERIDQSLQGCKQQLAAHPGDRDHQRMYLALYEEKIRLLEDVNRLAW